MRCEVPYGLRVIWVSDKLSPSISAEVKVWHRSGVAPPPPQPQWKGNFLYLARDVCLLMYFNSHSLLVQCVFIVACNSIGSYSLENVYPDYLVRNGPWWFIKDHKNVKQEVSRRRSEPKRWLGWAHGMVLSPIVAQLFSIWQAAAPSAGFRGPRRTMGRPSPRWQLSQWQGSGFLCRWRIRNN